ncbi:MAG: nuclear transport factor 2 family protein [Rhizobiaceae bacterium]|nr:nuclear transport factor 2 family protein [Rhizobiaceae bacterium]
MEDSIRSLFERYERFFMRSLAGEIGMGEADALYADAFIAASPAGALTGKNDDSFKKALADGYDHYRSIGTKAMRMRDIRVSPMDGNHCIAHVAWTAVYARRDRPDTEIDFDVHYLIQELDDGPRIFGWVSGDEQAVLKAHGIV